MASQKWTEVWQTVHRERRALADDLTAVPDQDWSKPSLCPGWDIHDVVAHLVDSAKTTRSSFVRRLIAARLDFDRDNERGIVRERGNAPAETLSSLQQVITATRTPPAPPATRLVEAIVHGEDIRRPLGLMRDYPVQPVVQALLHQLGTSVAMGGGRQRAAGFRLVAVDTDISAGSGPEVHAAALSLLLAVSGRHVDVAGFSGPGASAFAAHLTE